MTNRTPPMTGDGVLFEIGMTLYPQNNRSLLRKDTSKCELRYDEEAGWMITYEGGILWTPLLHFVTTPDAVKQTQKTRHQSQLKELKERQSHERRALSDSIKAARRKEQP